VVCSFIGYQTRGAAPSNFDINYAYNLGFAATRLIIGGFTGYMASIGNLKAPVAEWQPLGVPITALMISETQGQSPVVPKTIVDLNGPSFAALKEMRLTCSVSTPYRIRSCHTCSWLYSPKYEQLLFTSTSLETSPHPLPHHPCLNVSQVADRYENPGPLQFNGPSDLVDGVTSTLTLESFRYMQDIKKLQIALSSIQEACR
jgi:hypothetical protein